MATHSRILVWGHPIDRGAIQSMGRKESKTQQSTHVQTEASGELFYLSSPVKEKNGGRGGGMKALEPRKRRRL